MTTGRRRRGILLPAAVLGIVVLVPLAVLMGTVLALGWQLQVIETGSMRPGIPTGSLAVVEPADAGDVRAGMIVVFDDPALPGRLVAHRAVKQLPGSPPVWQTKGDANQTPDAYPVHAAAVRGRVRWTVPRLGSAVSAVASPVTAVLLIGIPLCLLVATEIVDGRRRRHGHEAADNAFIYGVHTPASAEDPRGELVGAFSRIDDAEDFVKDQPRQERLRIVRYTLTNADYSDGR